MSVKAQKDRPDHPGRKDRKAIRDQLDHQDRKASQDRKDHQDRKASPDRKASQDRKASEDQPDRKASEDQPDRKASKDHQVQPDRPANPQTKSRHRAVKLQPGITSSAAGASSCAMLKTN